MEPSIHADASSIIPATASASGSHSLSIPTSSTTTSKSAPQQKARPAQPFKYPTDPAMLIGLAISRGRAGGLAAVPEPVLTPLVAAATDGCGASRMVVEWLERRNSTKSGGGNEQK